MNNKFFSSGRAQHPAWAADAFQLWAIPLTIHDTVNFSTSRRSATVVDFSPRIRRYYWALAALGLAGTSIDDQKGGNICEKSKATKPESIRPVGISTPRNRSPLDRITNRMQTRKRDKSPRERINYLGPSKKVLPHDTIGSQMMPSLGEFILKERKGQPPDDQVEITSNQSKIKNPLIENKRTNNEGVGTSLARHMKLE